MAWMSQEKKKKIAEALKAAKLPFKFTIGVDNHSSLVVTIRQAPAYVLDDYKGPHKTDDRYIPVNAVADLSNTWEGKTLKHLTKMVSVIKEVGEWYDRSDSMTDYFNTAFYIDIQFGKWDKPCEFIGQRRKNVAETPERAAVMAQLPSVDAILRKPEPTTNIIPVSFGGRAAAAMPAPEVIEAALIAKGVEALRPTFGLTFTEEALKLMAEKVVRAVMKD